MILIKDLGLKFLSMIKIRRQNNKLTNYATILELKIPYLQHMWLEKNAKMILIYKQNLIKSKPKNLKTQMKLSYEIKNN